MEMTATKWYNYVIITIIFIIVYPYVFNSKLFLGGDNAAYFSLANSIADEFQYVDFFNPAPVPANHFPPGYPFILAIAIKLGIDTLVGLKIVNGLFLLGSVYFTYVIAFRFIQNNFGALLIAIASLFNFHLLEYASITMSEVPFLFFLLFTFYSFLRFCDSGYIMRSKWFILTLIGLMCVMYIRTQGIAIVGAVVFYLLLQKKWKAIAVVFGFLVMTYGPWQLRSYNLGGSSYVKQLFKVNPYVSESPKMELKDWGQRIVNNAERYTSKEIPNLLFPIKPVKYNDQNTGKPFPAEKSQWVLGIFIICLTAIGLWSFKKWRSLLISFFGVNVAIFMLWPDVWFGIRFILPMVPLILIGFFGGFKFLFQLISKHEFITSGKVYTIIALLFIAINFPALKMLNQKATGKHTPNWYNYLYVAEWAKDNLSETDIVVTRKPEIFSFISRNKSKTFVYTEYLDTIKADFEKHKITHVCFEQLGFMQTGKYLIPLLMKEPDRFELLYTVGAREGTDAQGNKSFTQDGVWLYKYDYDKGYFGAYDKGVKSGKGKYVYKSGDVFEGTWVNDTIQGPGVLKQTNGQTLKGTWLDGKREGTFILIDSVTQSTIESYWKSDIIDPIGYRIDSTGKKIGEIRLK